MDIRGKSKMARRGGIRRAEYKALLTEAYDLDKPEAPGEALAYYMRHIRACGEPVLEAMCGSGRFLAPLLEAGIDVDGVDASADMLAACAARCEERRIRARTYRQFLHELGLPRRYRLIFAGGASFGLIVDESEVTESLRRLYGHLLPGGTLLIEIETPRYVEQETNRPDMSRPPVRRWTRADGAEIVLRESYRYDRETGVVTGEGVYELIVSGERFMTERNDWVSRLWMREEFAARLGEAGFADVRATKAFSDTPLDGSERVVSFVARRPA